MTAMTAAGAAALEVRGLTAGYGGRRAVEGVDWAVQPGVLAGIVGPNGAGKSTLLKAALGLVERDAGEVRVFGGPLARARGRVVYVPQRSSVAWDFPITVGEVVEMGRYGVGRWWRRMGAQDKRAVEDALRAVGMEGMRARGIGELSGGQQQRVFLARALAQGGDLYLLDEPFVGVDIATEVELMGVLRGLRDAGKAVVVVSHDLNGVRQGFDEALLLRGRVVASGPVAAVFTPEHLQVAYGGKLLMVGEGAAWVVGA
jgi:manganese/zinc/iron transport system ATP- binding protein